MIIILNCNIWEKKFNTFILIQVYSDWKVIKGFKLLKLDKKFNMILFGAALLPESDLMIFAAPNTKGFVFYT